MNQEPHWEIQMENDLNLLIIIRIEQDAAMTTLHRAFAAIAFNIRYADILNRILAFGIVKNICEDAIMLKNN